VTYRDKPIKCFDCATIFTFSAAEQEIYASKGFTNGPVRCRTCREARNVQLFGGGERGRHHSILARTRSLKVSQKALAPEKNSGTRT
jgi:Probable zinc-ribbon domain